MRLINRALLYVLSLVILLLTTRCASVSYKSVTFDVLQPADYTLPTWTDTIMVVDNVVSRENVTRYAEHQGYTVSVTQSGSEFTLHIQK